MKLLQAALLVAASFAATPTHGADDFKLDLVASVEGNRRVQATLAWLRDA